MLPVISREYKVMLDHRLFVDRKEAAEAFSKELEACANSVAGVSYRDEFCKTSKREIVFLDTKDHTIHLNRFVLRKRIDLEKDRTEFTLKCRSPDRYVASGASVAAKSGFDPDEKLEEDISSPFIVRFSHSNTITGPVDAPQHLGQAAKLFPALGELQRDGEHCSESLRLQPVTAATVFERVLKGPKLRLHDVEATIALILWSDGPTGRPLVSEFSFRYGSKEEDYSTQVAAVAMDFFSAVQRLDWCVPNGRTKTQFAYAE